MNCNSLHKKIIFFLEGELPSAEMEQIKLHLSECSDCALFAEEIKKTLVIIENEKTAAINPFFYTRLKARIENEASKHFQGFRGSIFSRVLQPAFYSILLVAGIYSGIRIGQPAAININPVPYAEQELIPYLNDMQNEKIEAFLIDRP